MTPVSTDVAGGLDLDALVREKLCTILGAAQGDAVWNEVLIELGLTHLATIEDLRAFADVLRSKGGFEAAVGAMLSMRATMLETRVRFSPASRPD